MKTFKNEIELHEHFEEINKASGELMLLMLDALEEMQDFAEGIKKRSLLYC